MCDERNILSWSGIFGIPKREFKRKQLNCRVIIDESRFKWCSGWWKTLRKFNTEPEQHVTRMGIPSSECFFFNTRIICQKPSLENSISVSWWMVHRLWCHGPCSCPDWITVCWWNAENRWCRSKHQSDIGIMRQFGQQTTSLEPPQVRKLAGCGSCPLSLHSLLPSA